MGKVVVTAAIVAEWDLDTYRGDWGEDLSDDQILAECVQSMQDNPSFYANEGGLAHVEGALVS